MTVVVDPVVGRVVTLESGRLRARVLPDHGADIASIVERERELELLFQTPWGRRDRRHLPQRSDTQTAWLDAYGGGWQVLCPNGGFECEGDGGVRWGYHGEACLLAWRMLDARPDRVELEVDLATVPLRLHRTLRLADATLRLEERLTNLSARDVEAAWVQHPAFGPPLIDGGARIVTTAATVMSDPDIPGDLLPGGRRWAWPRATAPDGEPVDLSRLPAADDPRALLAYLTDFPGPEAEAAIVNDDLGLAVRMRWSRDAWPTAWLWQEVHATPGHPWFGRAHVCAVEPASTMPGLGAERVRELGGELLRVPAGGARTAWLELTVSTTAEAT